MDTYFDRIFIINLKSRTDRKEAMIKKLKQVNITNYEFVDAINGSEQPYYTLYLKRLHTVGFFEGTGAFGVLYSVLKVLMVSKINNYKKILILEDDVIFHKNFTILFEEKIKKIPSWKLLYLGTSMEKWRINERASINHQNGYLVSRGQIQGAFAVGIDSSIFQELINMIQTTNKPWDIGPLKEINLKYNFQVFSFYPYLTICETKDSNLRPGVELNNFAIQCGWNLNDF
jgi:GR25 family glycosyltransferase involved in LPS biosynthesis